MNELRQAALDILSTTDARTKVDQVYALYEQYQSGGIGLDVTKGLAAQNLDLPGRPPKPELVPPLTVPKRRMDTVEGRISLLHSLAHIEFNAINLALDAIWRFPEMPRQYYEDWLRKRRFTSLWWRDTSNHSDFRMEIFPRIIVCGKWSRELLMR